MQPPKTPLLTKNEIKICENLSKLNAGRASLRAAALLAVNKGATYPQAALQTGLTRGQVDYAASSFRKKKLAFFPANMVHQDNSQKKSDDQQNIASAELPTPAKKLNTVKETKDMTKSKKKAAKKKEKEKLEKKALKAKAKKAAKKAKKKNKLEKKTKKDKSTKKKKSGKKSKKK